MNPVRILLVDDHPENLLALEAILENTGHTLIRAGSGIEALKAVLRYDFALILMDVAMPDLDGYETAELIRRRQRSRQTPIIFLTANFKSDTHVFRGYSVGAVDYLFKPIVPDVLLSKVAVFVELYTRRQEIVEAAAALKRAYDELEERVEARTKELALSNESLKAEMAVRQRVELERAELLQSEQRARLEAQSMNRMKDEFLATLSHELRTPLNAIMGWAHILEVGPRDVKGIDRATRAIKNNAQAQAQLVADILDVSRIIGGNLTLHLGLVSIASVVEAALEAVQPAADAKGIHVTTVLPAATAIIVDRDRLQQVMWNLLSNAIKFTPKDGSVRVEIEHHPGDVVITVSDSGQGIEAAFLPHVFERFTQEDSSMGRHHGGLGLGMAIVRHLVELHGGTVSVASAGKNKGATFTVSLPLGVRPAEGADASIERRAGRREPRVQALPSLHATVVLVIDPDDAQRGEVESMLRASGADVTAVRCAADAFAAMDRRVPHVVISEIDTPEKDGLELVGRLRQREAHLGRDVPAIALGASGSSTDAVTVLAAGFHRHLSKPVTPAPLIEAVSQLAARGARWRTPGATEAADDRHQQGRIR